MVVELVHNLVEELHMVDIREEHREVGIRMGAGSKLVAILEQGLGWSWDSPLLRLEGVEEELRKVGTLAEGILCIPVEGSEASLLVGLGLLLVERRNLEAER